MRKLIIFGMAMILVLSALPFAFSSNTVSVEAQDAETPILVYISWDGSPGWMIERLLDEGKLPNLQRLADDGVWVQRTLGQWPSYTAAGHAAVFNGSYGNTNGITSNGLAAAPYSEYEIGARGASGYSSDGLITEPIWITAARQGLDSSLISVTQSSPFQMYTDPSFVSRQGLPGFGAFGDNLFIVDGYASRLVTPGRIVGGAEEGNIAIVDGAAEGWTNLPEGAAFKSFTIGGTSADVEEAGVVELNGLLVAPDGSTFDTIALSADGDYSTATILQVTPYQNDSSQLSDAVLVSFCPDDICQTGYVHLRATDIAADGSSFVIWNSYQSNLSNRTTDEARVADLLENGGAFTGNGPFLPSPFENVPQLPNVYSELGFLVNDWFFNNLVAEIEANENDLYFSYSPYPDEWHHVYYAYMTTGETIYDDPALTELAWSYSEAMYTNLDNHLGNVIDALENTGRPWNIVLFTDHGFAPTWRTVYFNRILKDAGLLVLNEDGSINVAETVAYYGGENSLGVYINTTDRPGGIVSPEDYDDVVQQVTDVLLAATDTDGTPLVEAIYRSEELAEEGLGGPQGAQLYIEPTRGYYWDANSGDGDIVTDAAPFRTGVHGIRPSINPEMQGFAVLGGSNFANGMVVEQARSTDLTPTAALAVGIEPAAHWTGTAFEDWVAAE